MNAPRSADAIVVPEDVLRAHVRECFLGVGLDTRDAEAVADVLVFANLRGLDAHGFERVPVYMRRVHAGLAGGSNRASVVRERGAVRRIDAAHALGPTIATRAIDEAMELARVHAVGLVVLGNSTHIGALGYYTVRAARRGFLAIAASNAAKLLAPHGAAERFLGTNPISFAAPVGDGDPFVLDMSSSIVAGGKVRRAGVLGEPIEPGLALDADGRPTTDPARAMAGALLPVGGHKGSGLAMAITLFVALLAEAEFDDLVASHYHDARPQNLGQLFIAIDPAATADVETGRRRTAAFAERFHALATREPGAALTYAGEEAARRERERRVYGIPLEREDLSAVAAACVDCGLEELAWRTRRLEGRAAPGVGAAGQEGESA